MITKTTFLEGLEIKKANGKIRYNPADLVRLSGTLHWSKMTGKMNGIPAIGRPMSPGCHQRHNHGSDDCICRHCYAFATNKIYKAVSEALLRNVVTPESVSEYPPLLLHHWRSNWNGDYSTVMDVLVDFEICEANPHVNCVAFTKSYGLVLRAIKEHGHKPSNYVLVLSSTHLNQPVARLPYVDKIFTVWTPEAAYAQDVEINCYSSCRSCMICYENKDGWSVNEVLKGTEAAYAELLDD